MLNELEMDVQIIQDGVAILERDIKRMQISGVNLQIDDVDKGGP